MTSKKLRGLIREKFAWPGGYDILFITSDGNVLCCECARDKYKSIAWSRKFKVDDGWRITGYFLSCDTDDVGCDHCYERFGVDPGMHAREEKVDGKD